MCQHIEWTFRYGQTPAIGMLGTAAASHGFKGMARLYEARKVIAERTR